MLHRGSNYLLARTMNGPIMRCGIISSCHYANQFPLRDCKALVGRESKALSTLATTVAKFGDSGRFFMATVAVFGDRQSPFLATVAEFGDCSRQCCFNYALLLLYVVIARFLCFTVLL